MFFLSIPAALAAVLSAVTGSTVPQPIWVSLLSLLVLVGVIINTITIAPFFAGMGLGIIYLIIGWPLILMFAALALGARGQKRGAGGLAAVSGIFFLPIGVLNIVAGVAYFREARQEEEEAAKRPTPTPSPVVPPLGGGSIPPPATPPKAP